MTRTGPVGRVRARLTGALSPEEVASIPDGYQRLGAVMILKLPEGLRRHFDRIGSAYRAELGVATVLRRRGPIAGEYRVPSLERISGDGTETEVREHGVVYRFDAARVMFAEGNKAERARVAHAVGVGERVVDLFAGIGYFTLPIAVLGRAGHVAACEANPESYRYLETNVRRNRVGERVATWYGRNEEAPFEEGSFDRAILGFLPSAVPWVGRALRLLRPSGGVLHVHDLVGVRDGLPSAEGAVRAAVERAGGRVLSASGRVVKPYGPGRIHTVVDVRAWPPVGRAP